MYTELSNGDSEESDWSYRCSTRWQWIEQWEMEVGDCWHRHFQADGPRMESYGHNIII